MPRNHKDNNLFSIDLEAIERVLEDANSPMLSQAEQIISKAIEYPNEINENAEAEELKSFLAQLRTAMSGLLRGDTAPVDLDPYDPSRFGKINPFSPEFRDRCAKARASKSHSSLAS